MTNVEEEWNQWLVGSCSVNVMRQIALEAQRLPDDWLAFEAYAARRHMPVNHVVYYLNAYQYGGDEGLQAVHNPDIIPPDQALRAIRTISRTLGAKLGRTPLRITDEGTGIGVYEIQMRWNGEDYLFEVCQLQVTLATGHWHLYWSRRFNAWWPYPPRESGAHSARYSLSARLRQVLADEGGCFWV